MCFFKKKKSKVVIETNFKVGDYVRFKYRGERYFGWVYQIYPVSGQETVYDIQIGGQCPAVLKGFKESELTLIEEK